MNSDETLSRRLTPSKPPDVAQVLLSIPLVRALALIAVWMDSQRESATPLPTRAYLEPQHHTYFEGAFLDEQEEL